MSDMPEPGRQAAHVFLDMLTAWDGDAEDGVSSAAMNLAARRLNDVGAVRAKLDENDVLDLDISDLVGGVAVTMQWLVELVAAAKSVDRLDIIAGARRFLDTDEQRYSPRG